MVALAGWKIDQPYYPIGVLFCSYGVGFIRLVRIISMDNFKHMSPGESAFRHDVLLDLYTAVDDRQDLRTDAGI
jgi:hypothetical protein